MRRFVSPIMHGLPSHHSTWSVFSCEHPVVMHGCRIEKKRNNRVASSTMCDLNVICQSSCGRIIENVRRKRHVSDFVWSLSFCLHVHVVSNSPATFAANYRFRTFYDHYTCSCRLDIRCGHLFHRLCHTCNNTHNPILTCLFYGENTKKHVGIRFFPCILYFDNAE